MKRKDGGKDQLTKYHEGGKQNRNMCKRFFYLFFLYRNQTPAQVYLDMEGGGVLGDSDKGPLY